MVSNNRYFFLNKEIVIYSVIKSLNLAKVHYLDNSELFFLDLGFITTEVKDAEPSLSLKVLGGIAK